MSAQKPTILFLHGALGVAQDMEPLMNLLSEKGYRTLAFNFSGHGTGAAWPNEFRIELFAKDLDKYVKEHELKNLTVFGYSMGGYVALFHKAHFEDSPIDRIITYGTKFNWSQTSVGRELLMLNPEHLESKFPTFSDTLKEKHGDRWKSILHSTAHLMQNLEKLDGLSREDLMDVDIPVTLLLGDQDRMVTTEETHLTKTWLHHADVKTVTHSKHEIDKANLKEISFIINDLII